MNPLLVHLLLDIRHVIGTTLVALRCELYEVLAAEAPILKQLAEWRTRMRLVVLQWAHVQVRIDVHNTHVPASELDVHVRECKPFGVIEQRGSISKRLIVSSSNDERDSAACKNGAYFGTQTRVSLFQRQPAWDISCIA